MPPSMPVTRNNGGAARAGSGTRAPMGLFGVLLATLLLAGCSSSSDQFAPACPTMRLLRDAADYSAYRAGGQDVTDLVLDGRITAAPASCRPGSKGQVRAKMTVAFTLTRGPAASGRETSVPYLVTVVDGERILDQKDFVLPVKFPPNTDRVALSGEEIELSFPVAPDKQASAYTIYVGFRLTPDQLALNRQRGPR